MELSNRLRAVADMVDFSAVTADIGCDHGYVSLYLVENRRAGHVIALDVNKGPLEKAREHIQMFGYSDYIETRLSDGLQALKPGEADTMVCAGMGGRLILRILSDGMDKVKLMKACILQPQSDIETVRLFLRENGFRIRQEEMVLEEGKFYPMMCALPDAVRESTWESIQRQRADAGRTEGESQSDARLRLEDKYGEYLLNHQNPVLKLYLEKEAVKYHELLAVLREQKTQRSTRRIVEVEEKIYDIRQALSYYR